MSFTPMQDALDAIQKAVKTIRSELAKDSGLHDEDAAADMDTALTSIDEATIGAFDAYTRLRLKRRPN